MRRHFLHKNSPSCVPRIETARIARSVVRWQFISLSSISAARIFTCSGRACPGRRAGRLRLHLQGKTKDFYFTSRGPLVRRAPGRCFDPCEILAESPPPPPPPPPPRRRTSALQSSCVSRAGFPPSCSRSRPACAGCVHHAASGGGGGGGDELFRPAPSNAVFVVWSSTYCGASLFSPPVRSNTTTYTRRRRRP